MAREANPPGIIETLSEGFRQVNRIVWVLLIPVGLDLFLWRGPRLSVAPVVRRALDWYSGRLPSDVASAQEALGQGPEQLRQTLEATLSGFNLFSVLAINIAAVPSFVVGRAFAGSAALEVVGFVPFLALTVVLELAGLLLGCCYLGVLAQQVRDERIDHRQLLTKVWRNWLSVLGFMGLAAGVLLAVTVPFSLLAGLAIVVAQPLGAALVLLGVAVMQVGFFAAVIYLFFLVDAILISEVGPIRAARNSVRMVSRNFWSALGLIVLIFVILAGTQYIWGSLAPQEWGPLPGIVGNAYIASGLSAASMLFYRHRVGEVPQ